MSDYLEIGDVLNAVPKQVDLNSTQIPNATNLGESKIDLAKVVIVLTGAAIFGYLIYEITKRERLKVKPTKKD